MSGLVLRKKSKRRGHKSAFWSANVPPFDEVLQKSLGRNSWNWLACVPLALLIVAVWGVAAHAQDEAITPESVQAVLDNIWITVAAVLVIFMNAGFGMLETGFCRQKNAVNILSKNLIVFALATLAYWAIGFSLMYGAGGNGWIGGGGWFLSSADPATYGLDESTLTIPVSFLFQVAFAATAATIVSGAVAERIKFIDFIIFSILLTGISYPITGHWVWAGGWLSELGFSDFAGSTVVHSVGGWAALMGAAFLGPRIGKYQDGRVNAIPGHSMTAAMLGCLILWIGWFGFNPGSELAASLNVPYIAVTTNLAGAAGGVAATITAWTLNGKPDLSMIINGILAGLVGITAGCAGVGYWGAVIIGLIAGVLVVFSVAFFDSIRIDDPVGATSVHLVCGIWGTLAVGLFDKELGLFYGAGVGQLGIQIVGILTIGLFTVVFSTICWLAIKAVLGLRVAPEEELKGLDIAEHGMEAYSGFLKDTSDMGTL
ncbi:MAG: ammonium transporter [Leptolyngbyaceae cyanobacterium SM1_1_3]|nr:ammonium transporter [Leptolyngbyaceae cyanobacterium SM1_1_3]NJN04694.1 ammonium transporter [Leptolyngbyaceae cyanobacterium RM1_1_2]NJO11451.1 ammonium transporter [Leptolyngbyaceae cyanobacterium SL_1_1]